MRSRIPRIPKTLRERLVRALARLLFELERRDDAVRTARREDA